MLIIEFKLQNLQFPEPLEERARIQCTRQSEESTEEGEKEKG